MIHTEDREKFEEWYVEEISGCNGEWVARMDNGQYYEIPTNKAWLAWQAATLAERERCLKICEDSNCNCYENIKGE